MCAFVWPSCKITGQLDTERVPLVPDLTRARRLRRPAQDCRAHTCPSALTGVQRACAQSVPVRVQTHAEHRAHGMHVLCSPHAVRMHATCVRAYLMALPAPPNGTVARDSAKVLVRGTSPPYRPSNRPRWRPASTPSTLRTLPSAFGVAPVDAQWICTNSAAFHRRKETMNEP